LREADTGKDQDSQDYFQPMLKSDELGLSQDEDDGTFDFDVDIVDQPAVSTSYA